VVERELHTATTRASASLPRGDSIFQHSRHARVAPPCMVARFCAHNRREALDFPADELPTADLGGHMLDLLQASSVDPNSMSSGWSLRVSDVTSVRGFSSGQVATHGSVADLRPGRELRLNRRCRSLRDKYPYLICGDNDVMGRSARADRPDPFLPRFALHFGLGLARSINSPQPRRLPHPSITTRRNLEASTGGVSYLHFAGWIGKPGFLCSLTVTHQ
jgi:hypothetical protein